MKGGKEKEDEGGEGERREWVEREEEGKREDWKEEEA